jgi:hypothetical protein
MCRWRAIGKRSRWDEGWAWLFISARLAAMGNDACDEEETRGIPRAMHLAWQELAASIRLRNSLPICYKVTISVDIPSADPSPP